MLNKIPTYVTSHPAFRETYDKIRPAHGIYAARGAAMQEYLYHIINTAENFEELKEVLRYLVEIAKF